MTLRTPICEMFGIEKPVFLAGMGGVAYARVCAAVSEAGGYGTLGMGASPPERIRDQMRRVRKLTDKPFGVDMLAALPDLVSAAIDVSRPVRKWMPASVPARPYRRTKSVRLAIAIAGVSPGSKLTTSTSNSRPASKVSGSIELTTPLMTCVQRTGHS